MIGKVQIGEFLSQINIPVNNNNKITSYWCILDWYINAISVFIVTVLTICSTKRSDDEQAIVDCLESEKIVDDLRIGKSLSLSAQKDANESKCDDNAETRTELKKRSLQLQPGMFF